MSQDCAHLKFSASLDSTTLEMIYQDRDIPLPYEGNLVIAPSDSSLRIWEYKINQLVGNPSLREDILLALVMSGDSTDVTSVLTPARQFLYGIWMGCTCNAQSGGSSWKVISSSSSHLIYLCYVRTVQSGDVRDQL